MIKYWQNMSACYLNFCDIRSTFCVPSYRSMELNAQCISIIMIIEPYFNKASYSWSPFASQGVNLCINQLYIYNTLINHYIYFLHFSQSGMNILVKKQTNKLITCKTWKQQWQWHTLSISQLITMIDCCSFFHVNV